MSDSTDYYEVLGVDRTATSDEIKRAYRKLARTHHPDINKDPSAEARFKEIGQANEVLSDPGLRARYDAFGADFRHVPDDVDPEEWANAQRMRDQGGRPSPGQQQNVDDAAFQDFFEDLLREQGRTCLLYTSAAADDLPCVDLGGRRIIKKTNKNNNLLMQLRYVQ